MKRILLVTTKFPNVVHYQVKTMYQQEHEVNLRKWLSNVLVKSIYRLSVASTWLKAMNFWARILRMRNGYRPSSKARVVNL